MCIAVGQFAAQLLLQAYTAQVCATLTRALNTPVAVLLCCRYLPPASWQLHFFSITYKLPVLRSVGQKMAEQKQRQTKQQRGTGWRR
jgi:hypothetical protein